MNIGIIGGGATGLLISYYLSMTHCLTLYVRRKEQKEKINKNGIRKIDKNETLPIKAKMIHNINEHDLIIICVKSNDIQTIIKLLNDKNIKAPLLFLQNGMGHVDLFPSLENDILVGVIEHGVVKENDFTFNHLGKGKIKIASFSGNVPYKDNLANEQFPFEYVSNWEQLLKEKLIVNAVINPLTALFNVKNRYIVKNTYIYKIAKRLCYDVATILSLDRKKSWQRVQTIATNTGANTSSMRSDILNGKETEIESILGFVLSQTKM